MSGSGGGSQQVIQKQTSEPPEWMVPYLKQQGEQAKKLYEGGVGPNYYPGATYVGPTTQEMAGMRGIQNLATQGNKMLPGVLNAANSSITNYGLSPQQRQAMQPVNEVARMDLGAGNPYLMGLLDIAADKSKTAMETSFGGMGREGGAATGVIGREIGDLYTTGLANNYQQNVANRLNASGQLQGVLGQGQQNAQQWAGMVPQIRDMQFDDPRRLIDVGAAQREELQTELQDNISRYNAQQSRPWDQLALYNNAVSGLGGNSGQQTIYGQRGSPLAGILGGAMAGGSMGGQFGGAGGLLGLLLGGGLGAFL